MLQLSPVISVNQAKKITLIFTLGFTTINLKKIFALYSEKQLFFNSHEQFFIFGIKSFLLNFRDKNQWILVPKQFLLSIIDENPSFKILGSEVIFTL